MNILEKWRARGLAADKIERMIQEEIDRLNRLEKMRTGMEANYWYEKSWLYAQAKANVERFLIENQ